MNPSLDDYRWLVSDAAQTWLVRASQRDASILSLTDHLRRELSPARTHLVLEQIELRRRAAAKFADADRMFFTRLGLQQASGEGIARYKAGRFGSEARVADLCCGIGGDLAALAGRGPAVGIDRDPVAVILAAANTGARVKLADVADVALDEFDAWHIDPDRRPEGRRTTRAWLHEPAPETIDTFRRRRANGAIKLAPAAEAPEDWIGEGELEWIGEDRECKQLVVWLGQLAARPGVRRATVLHGRPPVARTISGDPTMPVDEAPRIGRYVLEPHATVIVAQLVGALAAEHDLAAITPGVAYLTGERPIEDPALATFEVCEVLPLRIRTIKALLRERGIGRLEVKRRGVNLDPEQLRRRLRVPGEDAATLLITPTSQGVRAIVARRLVAS